MWEMSISNRVKRKCKSPGVEAYIRHTFQEQKDIRVDREVRVGDKITEVMGEVR